MKATKKVLGILALVAAFVLVVAGCDTSNDPAPQEKPADTILEETSSVGAIKSRAPLTNEEKTAVTANINSVVNSADFAWYKTNAGTLDIYIENGLAGSEAGLHLTLDEAKGAASAITTKAIAHFKALHIFETEDILTDALLDLKKEKGLTVDPAARQKIVAGYYAFENLPHFNTLENNGLNLVVIIEDLSDTEPHFAADGLHFPLSFLLDEANASLGIRGHMVQYVNSLELALANKKNAVKLA
jgi:hypothetical protein